MNDKIKVVIKLRPLIEGEKDSSFSHWGVKGSTIFQIDPATRKLKNDCFTFDHIFDQSSTNQEIFSTVVKPIVDAAIQGFNGTIFAYGQTCSGKTHTMTGTSMQPGIIPTAIKYMFSSLEMDKKREFLLRVSYLEIYNEKVNDLLGNAQNIILREDSNGQITVGADERVCNCVEKVLENKAVGEKNRRIGETNMNERSSRSHTIFRVILESSIKRTTSMNEEENEDEGFVKISQLNLVDLAGSERAGQSGMTGDRFKEGCHINSSLTTLGLVIKQLGDGNEGQHISFRDSKLTRLLKPSLGGNALTVIICTVTPTVIDQTLNTLNFALRAKKVKNKPELNEASDDAALIKRYRKKIAILNQELENTKKRTSSTEELETKLQDLLKQERRIAKMKEDLINSGVSDISKNNQALGRSKRRRTWGGQLESSLLLPMRVQLSTIKEDSMAAHRQCKSISADNISETEVKESHRTPIFVQDIGKGNGDVGLLKHSGLCEVIKPIAPETPPRVLRERIRSEADRAKSLETEYMQLKEYTTLEKQIFHTDGRKFEEDNEALNEKLFNALSSITELTGDKERLENQLEEQISTVQKLKSKLNDIEVIKENTEKKFAERENELRKSLDEAWDNLRQKDATIDYLKENIDQLQSNLRVCVDNSGASSLMEQNKILQQKLNHFMKIDEPKKNLEFHGSLLTPLAEQIALKETKIQNQNLLLAQRAKIHQEENQHMMSQVEILETKLKELGWTSESENKYQQQNLLLTKEIEIKDKEIKTLVSMNESLVTNLKELEIITKCKNSNKNLLAEEVENNDEKIKLLISSNEILEINQFDSISGNENELGEVRQLITLIEYKDQEVSNLKTHNLQLQNDLKRLEFIAEHENKLQERILELTDELESKREATLNLNNHSENLGISSENSLDNQEQIVSIIDKNQLDKANCTQISPYNISEKYEFSIIQDNIEFIPCDESLLFKDTLSQTVNNDPLQSFSSELDMNIENRTAIHGENFLLIEPNIQLENKLGYVSPLQRENTELFNKTCELERILENSTTIQEKNMALAGKLTLYKEENVSTIQQVNIKLSNKAKELELILENSNTIQKENIALSENIKILESKVEHISLLQEINKDLIHKKRDLEQQLERSKLIDEENLMLLEKIKLIESNLKDMFTLQEKNKELSNQIEHLEKHFENNIEIQNKNIELKDKYKLLESNVDHVSTLQQENIELTNKLEELETNSESIIAIQNENIKLKERLKLMVINLSDVSALKQENIKLTNKLEELEINSDNINIIQNENIKLKEKLKLLDSNANHASNLQQENRELANEIEDMEKNLESINTIQNENVKLKDKLTLLHSNVDHVSCLQQENNELSHKIDGLERNSKNIITIQKENVELKESLALLHSTMCHASALQQENGELSKTIEEIEKNLENISELQKKNIELKEKLDSNEDHASTVQKENKELTNKLEELETNSENIITIQNENIKLKERLKLMVRNLSDVSALKQENIKLTNKLEELEINSANINIIQNENIKLKEKLKLLDSNANHASNLQQENKDLANEIEDMEKNLENINTIQNENVKLKDKLTLLHSNVDHASCLQQENNELSHKIDGLERNSENIITIQKENVELKESLALLHSTMCHASALQQENRELSKTIEEMETNLENISELQKKNIELKEKLDSNKDHASTVQKENKELTNKLEELETNSENIITIQNENIKLKERLKLMVSNLSDVSALKQENIKLTNKLEELEINSDNINIIQNENIKLKEKLKLLDSNANHASNLQQENRELANEIEDMEKNLESINTIQNENFKLKDKLTLLHSNVDHVSCLQQENNELSHKIDGLERNSENIITIQKENVELKESLALFHSTMCHASALQQENRELSKTIEEIENNLENISELQKKNIELKEKLDSNKDHASTVQKENKELTNKLEELETNSENIITIQNENIKLKERLKLVVRNLSDVSALKQENIKLTNKLEELEINSANINIIQNENIKLKEKLKLLDSNVNHASNLQQENKDLANEIEDMEKNLENINTIQNENVKLKDKLTLLHSNVDHASCLQQENNELSYKIDGLERNSENIITIQKENVELKESLALLHSTMCHASALQQENRELSKTIEEMETNLENISELQKKNIELKEKLVSNEDHASTVQKENKELTNKLEELETNSENIITIQNENIKLKERLKLMVSNLSDVSALKQENIKLTNKLEELEINSDNINIIQNENIKLKEKLKLLDSNANHASNLQQENRELANEIEDMEKNLESINTIKNENVKLKDKLTLLHSNVDHVSCLQQENNELSHKIDGLERNSENIITIQKENVELKESLALLHSTMCHASALQQENRELSKTIEEMETNLESISELPQRNIELKETPISLEDHVESVSTLPQGNRELSNKSQKLDITLDSVHPVKEENCGILESITEYASMLQVLNTVEEQPKYSEENDQISLSRIKELEKTISELTKRNITLFESLQNSDLLKGKIITEILSLDPNITDKLHKFKITELFDKLMYVLLRKEEEILSKFQDSCEAKVKGEQDMNKQLEIQANRLREWITEIENENERLSNELATILRDHEHIQSQLKRKNNEIKEKDDKVTLLENKILLLQEESLNGYTELNAIQKEHKLCKNPEHFNEKLKILQDALKTKDIELKIQDEKVNRLTIKEIQLSRSIEAEEKKNKELSDSITDQSKELKILELLCKRSKDELNAKNDEINCLISEIRLKEDKWKLCVCQQKENLTQSQCQSVIDEYKELLFHLKDHPHGITKKLNSIADNFKLLKSVIELFKEKIEQEELVSVKQIKDLETKLAEKDKICQELQSNINNLTKINTNNNKLVEDLRIKDDNLKTVIKKLEDKTKECSNVLLKLEEVENTLDAKNVENNKSREIYVKTCKELQNLKTAYVKEKDQNNNLTEKIESLLLQVNTLNNKNEIVEEQLDMLKCELNKNEDFFQKVGNVLQKSPTSLSEVLLIITENVFYINELLEKLEVIQNINKKLNTDYISLKTEIIQRDEELSVVLQREQTLKEQYQILKMQISTQINSDLDSNSKSVNEFESHLFNIIPGNPTSISEAFCIISNVFKEVEYLKSNIELMQEEKDILDKECDFMNNLVKGTEIDLLNTQRQCSEYASDVTDLKNQITETKQSLLEKVNLSETLLKDNDALKLEVSVYENVIREHRKEKGKMMLQISEYKNKIKTGDIALQQLKLEENHLNDQINNMTELYKNAIRSSSSVECHCEEFKNKITELTISVADRNAKITALELQIQSDNVPKKHFADLENSLEQAKEKIKELKSDIHHYQMLSQETSLRDCEICRRRIERVVHTSVQTTNETSVPSTSSSCFEIQGTIEDKKYFKYKKEIDMLKRILRLRNKRIEELEKELNNRNVLE